MGILDDVKEKLKDFKDTQHKRREFKKKLDFEKFKAVEIAKAKQEIKDIKDGKKPESPMDNLLGYDPEGINL